MNLRFRFRLLCYLGLRWKSNWPSIGPSIYGIHSILLHLIHFHHHLEVQAPVTTTKNVQGNEYFRKLINQNNFSVIYQTSINLRVPEDCHFEVLMVVATTVDSNIGHTAHIALNNRSNFPMRLVL